ncbi:MAG: hypothetical protein ACK4WD_05585 [Flavobacteriales bacterium]|jgi:hypothetical protein
MSGNLGPRIQFLTKKHICPTPLLSAVGKNIILKFIFTVFIVWSWNSASAQITSLREKKLAYADTLVLDSLSIIPYSIKIKNSKGEFIQPVFIDIRKALIVLPATNEKDSVIINYAVFPTRIPDSFRNKDTTMILKGNGTMISGYRIESPSTASLFDDSGIKKSGSISRGIAVGNAQNLTVSSTLNLQVSGKLNDRFSIMGSVSDDNIPIQPNGNTQQLQDFDQVFIQVYDARTKLIAGDFILKKPNGYFMNYFKRAQGAYVFTEQDLNFSKAKKKLTVEASGSISKGRFARNLIQGIEGNQGPYRLTGADNELFIVILAGTEQVFIDGRLLERGQDKDYIIDYNSAEIIFTPRQFITKDRRIVVEFQYSERRFARPMISTAVTFGDERNSTYLNFFSESDAKNQPLQQDLTQEDKRILAGAGDGLLNAIRSGVDSTGYNNSNVLYRLVIDSLGFDSVFVFSTNSENAFYRVQFNLVGQGNGDYVEDGFTSAGRKYRWVAPELAGDVLVRRGNYAPVVLLATPKKRQMLTAGHQVTWKKRNKLGIEGSLSNNDLNTFSDIDSEDDLGYALKLNWDAALRQRVDSVTKVKTELFTTGQYEYANVNFVGIERFREVEFDRNWNIRDLNLISDLHWGGANLGWQREKFGKVSAGVEFLNVGSGFSGRKVNAATDILTSKWKSNIKASALQTEGNRNTTFVRHISDISRSFGKWRIGFKDEHELNQIYGARNDSVVTGAYRFYDWQVSVGIVDSTKYSASIYYRDRLDWLPKEGLLSGSARADEYGFLFEHRGKKENRFKSIISNRRLRSVDPELFTREPENTLVMRLEYYYRTPSAWLLSSTFYEVGSGLEQRREFIYLEVQPGQGVYVWIDYNGDGIKDLNEFEVAQFEYEANYIRSFIQTTDYVRTYTNQFSQSLQIQTGRNWKNDKPWKKFIGRWSNQTSYKVDRKTGRELSSERFNPFANTPEDSVLIALSGSVRSVLFFNKANPTFGADYTVQDTRGKNLLSNGFESREEQFHQLAFRWALPLSIILNSEQKIGTRTIASDFLSGRNYSIEYLTVKPKLSWQPDNTRRFALVGEWSDKRNTQGAETAEILSYGIEFNWNSLEKGLFQGGVNFFNIRYDGAANNSLSFDMLEGLNPGFNVTWNVGLQRTLGKSLQLNITYNGRKPDDVRTIHAGGVQLRAFF